MQIKTQRFFILCLFMVLGTTIIIQSCKKEETFPDPSLEFDRSSGFQYNDTTLMLSDVIKVKILAETQSDVPLTQFHIDIDKDDVVTPIDSGINTNVFNYEKTIIKSSALVEKWTFYVKDKEGRKSEEISVTLNLDEASIFGDIIYIQSVTLGAQNHATIGGFYSLEKDIVYTASEAFNNQSDINLFYFYDTEGSDANTLASPGANIDAAIFDFSGWTTKNTTRFETDINVSIDEFNACTNDSLILNNTFEFSTGNRKAKKLTTDQIFAFVTNGEKKGLIRVINVIGDQTGTVEIAIKMED